MPVKLDTKPPVEGVSLYLFPEDSKLRTRLSLVIQHKAFDASILSIIVLSSILLAIDTPLKDPKSGFMKAIHAIDFAVMGVFVVEAALKIVVYGFVFNGKTSYLKDPWNALDFTIVIVSLLSSFMATSLKSLKVFRLLRILRPLRVISRNEGLKLSVKSLFHSLPGILNVLILSGIFYLLFGIFFTNLFKGRFYYCH